MNSPIVSSIPKKAILYKVQILLDIKLSAKLPSQKNVSIQNDNLSYHREIQEAKAKAQLKSHKHNT